LGAETQSMQIAPRVAPSIDRTPANRSFFSASVREFLEAETAAIVGRLSSKHVSFHAAAEAEQIRAWEREIDQARRPPSRPSPRSAAHRQVMAAATPARRESPPQGVGTIASPPQGSAPIRPPARSRPRRARLRWRVPGRSLPRPTMAEKDHLPCGAACARSSRRA